MALIKVLDKETIDKIAAGEVVERPASVVKELLENAIDAGAGAVTVEIKEGGISFIRVTDNGCGIDKTDASNAFLRHATSKIRTAADLFRVMSLGFRGEALSSIAAVARLEMITKTKQELTGLRYLIEGGTQKEVEEVGAPEGTTMIVRNLFFNTPVRKKFLKQPQTEGGYISDLMEHMAMSHPYISFKYLNNAQTRFHTSGNGNLQEIIYRIYGREIQTALLPIDVKENGIRMYGFLGKPEINRSNRNFEIYFVNGRFIKSNIIGKGIEEGYRKYVMQHKFPFAVLHFEIEAQDIDVNVHPTKMEVRFTNQEKLYDFIAGQIAEQLHEAELIPEVILEAHKREELQKLPAGALPEPFETRRREESMPERESSDNPVSKAHTGISPEPSRTQATDAAVTAHSAYTPGIVKEENPYTGAVQEDAFFVESIIMPNKEETKEAHPQMQDILHNSPKGKIIGTELRSGNTANAENHANIIKADEHIFVEKPVQMDLFEEKILTRDARMEYRILGQVFDTYWLIAFKDRLLIVDQHAAHEKVKYERFIKELQNRSVQSQLLDPPVIVTLSGREESVLKEQAELFGDMGFEIEVFGGSEYAIRSVPTDLYGLGERGLFKEMLDELSDGPLKGAPTAIRSRIATMACKAAVKGNTSFGAAEMEALIDELLTLDDPYHCPHGRPTIISMSKYELEKKFKRIL